MEFERDVEKYLVRRVKQLGGRCIKLHTAYEEGLPDRMVLLPAGVMFFVELKRRAGVLSPMQKAQHRSLRKLGQRVYTPYSKLEVDNVLEKEGSPSGI